MSFNKVTSFNVNSDDVEIMDNELLKIASVKLPDGIDYDPDYFYMKVKAVSAGESWGANKNYDYFPRAELKGHYKTFLAAHVFKNHENKKIEGAIGDVLTAEWSDKMDCVYLMIRVDKRIAPSIARGFEKGFMTDVSMGCRVDHVICSYCGKKAKTRLDYCDHLKSMKGKVMDNGKKVYEINIAPKFHDISAVLNGAERTAKAEKIYLSGQEKTASENLEKVASHLNFNEPFKNNYFDEEMEIIASSLSVNNKDENLSEKIAEFKKKIHGKVVATAQKSVAEKNLGNLEKISDTLKLLYTKHWDKKKCTDIADKIKDIAKSNRTAPEVAFDQFLKVADFAGIELSPLEIHDIFHEVVDVDTHDLRKIYKTDKAVDDSFVKTNNQLVSSSCPDSLNLSSSICAASSLADSYDEPLSSLETTPGLKVMAIMSCAKKPNHNNLREDIIQDDLMNKIIKSLLPERSNHRSFLMPRLEEISAGHINPNFANAVHYIPTRSIKVSSLGCSPRTTLPAVISGILHSLYQRDRVSRYNNGELDRGIMKFASELGYDDTGLSKIASVNKVAKISPTKAALTGIPLTLSYSALQRSRMNNREDISSLNRYIAENPGNAAMLQSAITAGALRKGKSIKKSVVKNSDTVIDKGKEIVKKIVDDDMFKKAEIDSMMLEKGYTKTNLDTIKIACALMGVQKEDMAEISLDKQSLSLSDVDEYLKTAEQCFRIEVEKTAGSLKNISMSLAGDILLDNPKKTSALAAVPGYLVDGLALAGIGKGLQIAANKNKKGVQQENV